MFSATFNGASKLTGLKSLAIPTDRRDEADPAADVLYEIAEEVPWMRWLIEPANKWCQRGFVLGMFSYGMYRGVALELAMKRAAAASTAKARREDVHKSGDRHEDMAVITLDQEEGSDDE